MIRRVLLYVSLVLGVLIVAGNACAQPEPTGGLPFDNPLQPSDSMEAHILEVLETMRAGRQHYNVSVQDGRVLRLLTETMDAQRVVESVFLFMEAARLGITMKKR